jgi:hypothetical protein
MENCGPLLLWKSLQLFGRSFFDRETLFHKGTMLDSLLSRWPKPRIDFRLFST